MRVLFFSRTYTLHDRRFLAALTGAGHAVDFLPLIPAPDYARENPLPAGVRLIEWSNTPPRSDAPDDLVELVPQLSRIIEETAPDVLHAGPVPTCGYVAALTGFRPLISMSWAYDILVDIERDQAKAAAAQRALAGSDFLICDARVVEDRVRAFAGDDQRIVRFPWGINVDRFAPAGETAALEDELGWRDCTIVLSTRAWEKVCGVIDLVEAFALASERDRRLRLILLGTGSEAARIDEIIAAKDLEHAVWRPGNVANGDLPSIFRAADIYSSCSHTDGTSISLLEALATGLPVVVSDLPGNREWVDPQIGAWLSPVGARKACADALVEAAQLDGTAREEVRDRHRRIAESRADWQQNSKHLLDVYATLEREFAVSRAAPR